MMPYWNGSTTQDANKADYLFVPITSGNYTFCRVSVNASSGYNAPSLGIYVGNSASTAPSALYQANDGSANFGGPIPIAQPSTFGGGLSGLTVGKWSRITLHLFYNASGTMEVFVNGVLAQTVVTDMTGITWSAQTLAIVPPQLAGIGYRITGPIQTANDTTFTCRPSYDLEDVSAQVTKQFLPFATAQSGGITQGRQFQVSGSGTIAVNTQYNNAAGQSPFRHKLHFTGAGNNPIATTIDQIGTLPFNEEGWAHIVWSDLHVPKKTTDGSNGTLTLRTYGSDDSTPFYTFQLAGTIVSGAAVGTLYATYGSGTVTNLGYYNAGEASEVTTTRYCLILHLHKSGTACYSLIDMSLAQATVGNSQQGTIISGPLPDWSPSTFTSLGVTKYDAVPGATAIECGFIAVCRRPSLACVDSLTSAPYTTTTPIIQTAAHVARSFPFGEETTSLPGGYYPLLEYGMARRIIIPIGRSGLTRRDFSTRILPGMTFTKGCEIMSIDGGSINDLSGLGSSDATPVLNKLRDLYVQALQLWTNNQNRVWAATMLPRTRSFTLSAVSKANPAVCTSAGHGLTNGTNVGIAITGAAGLSVDINGVRYARVTGANTFTLYDSTNTTGIDTSAATGTYTASSATVKGYSATVLAAITSFNAMIRDAVFKYQKGGLISFSDIETDAANNPSTYPNSTAFWSGGDFTHPGDGNPLVEPNGSPVIARRMHQIKIVPPTSRKPRRWPLMLTGRLQ
jgi:hypothetical protein